MWTAHIYSESKKWRESVYDSCIISGKGEGDVPRYHYGHHKCKIYWTHLNHCTNKFSLLIQGVYNFWTYHIISTSNSGVVLRTMNISTTGILINLKRQD
jgi:hypothetical protein